MKKNFFDFSHGMFHKGIAHFYTFLGWIYLLIAAITLMFGTKITASFSLAVLVLLIIPQIVTAFLAMVAVLKNRKTQFQIYAYTTIGYSVVALFFCNYIRALIDESATTLGYFLQGQFSVFNIPISNPLPGVGVALVVANIMLVLAIIFMAISLYLFLANVQPKPVVKVEQPAVVQPQETEVEEVSQLEEVSVEAQPEVVETEVVETEVVETEVVETEVQEVVEEAVNE